ncbi:MAG: hypothetical protein ACJAYG_000228 [Oceanicoccus sp.]
MKTKITLGGLLLGITLIFNSAIIQANESFSKYVSTDGTIQFPVDFRMSMVHLGSWFVPTGDASGFHDVYTERESAIFYQQNGYFPDGATLVKELRASKSGDFTTGRGVQHSTSSLKQWFVMVKDSENRFVNNPIWGDGWGWALFKPDSVNKNSAVNYRADCLGCHIPAKDSDWVYKQAYPILTP